MQGKANSCPGPAPHSCLRARPANACSAKHRAPGVQCSEANSGARGELVHCGQLLALCTARGSPHSVQRASRPWACGDGCRTQHCAGSAFRHATVQALGSPGLTARTKEWERKPHGCSQTQPTGHQGGTPEHARAIQAQAGRGTLQDAQPWLLAEQILACGGGQRWVCPWFRPSPVPTA